MSVESNSKNAVKNAESSAKDSINFTQSAPKDSQKDSTKDSIKNAQDSAKDSTTKNTKKDSRLPALLAQKFAQKTALILAPLAGYTDLPFRSVVKRFGVDLTISEMVSSHALVYSNKKTLKMCEKSPEESPFSLQISGSKVGVLRDAVALINQMEGVDIIDFNCGCPAPKVAHHGNGSGLLKDLNALVTCAKTIRESTKKATSIKVRLGFDVKIPTELAHALNDTGADFVAVHGRTKTDGYKKERIDYDAIAAMKKIARMPLVANGEIDSVEKAMAVRARTDCDGVMIGRAAVTTPWIFWQIANATSALPSVLKLELVLAHFDSMVSFYGDFGAVMFRKNLHAYTKAHADSSHFREVINSQKHPASLRDLIIEFFTKNPAPLTPKEQIITLNKRTS